MTPELRLSVVIPTHGRLSQVDACLESIYGSSYRPVEVIIVDSTSDATHSKSEWDRISDRFPQKSLKYIYTEFASASYQRNLGAQKANGEIIFFCDDDCLVDPDCFSKVIEVYKRDPDRKVGGVCPVNHYEWHYKLKAPFLKIARYFFRRIKVPLEREITYRYPLPSELSSVPISRKLWFIGYAMSFRRESFFSIGGFDENLLRYSFNEDFDIGYRMALSQILLARNDAYVTHRPHPSARPATDTQTLISFLNPAYMLKKHRFPASSRRAFWRAFVIKFTVDFLQRCFHLKGLQTIQLYLRLKTSIDQIFKFDGDVSSYFLKLQCRVWGIREEDLKRARAKADVSSF